MSSAGRSTGVLVGRICCVLVCLLYCSNKSFAPHLSPSLSVRESQLCVFAFSLKHLLFDTLMTLPNEFLSDRDWIELCIAAYFQMVPFIVLFSSRYPQALEMYDDGRRFWDPCTAKEKKTVFLFSFSHTSSVFCVVGKALSPWAILNVDRWVTTKCHRSKVPIFHHLSRIFSNCCLTKVEMFL